jgi:hypothetical protein
VRRSGKDILPHSRGSAIQNGFITLRLDQALMIADRHLCHCEPMRRRTAIEQGYTLTPEEEKLADQEYVEWWYREVKKHQAVPAGSWRAP